MAWENRAVTLTEFLLARIEEERQLAWSAVGLTPAGRPGMGWQVDEDGALLPNPPRLIEECETKGRVLDLMQQQPDFSDPLSYSSITVRLLALPYADHDDYREEWRL